MLVKDGGQGGRGRGASQTHRGLGGPDVRGRERKVFCQRQGSRRPPPLRHPKSDQLPGPLTGRGRLGPLLAPPRLPGGKEGL